MCACVPIATRIHADGASYETKTFLCKGKSRKGEQHMNDERHELTYFIDIRIGSFLNMHHKQICFFL